MGAPERTRCRAKGGGADARLAQVRRVLLRSPVKSPDSLFCTCSRHATSLGRTDASSIWTTSPTVTTQHLLQIVCLLRVFLNYPGQPSRSSFASGQTSHFVPMQTRRDRLPRRSSTLPRVWPTLSDRSLRRPPLRFWPASGSIEVVRHFRFA